MGGKVSKNSLKNIDQTEPLLNEVEVIVLGKKSGRSTFLNQILKYFNKITESDLLNLKYKLFIHIYLVFKALYFHFHLNYSSFKDSSNGRYT